MNFPIAVPFTDARTSRPVEDDSVPEAGGAAELAGGGAGLAPVAGVDVGVRAHARVEQEHSLRVVDDVTEARFHSGTARPGLLRWPHEVAEINPPHRNVSHSAILADHPGKAHSQR